MALKGFSFTSLTKYIRDLVAGIVAFTTVKCTGEVRADGSIISKSSVTAKSGSLYSQAIGKNNCHYWFMNEDGTERGVMYAEPFSNSIKIRNAFNPINVGWAFHMDGTFESQNNIKAGGSFSTKGGEIVSYGRNDVVSLHGSTHSFMTANKGASYICTNSYWDGSWKKFNSSKVSNIITVNSSGAERDGLILYHSQAGVADPIQAAYNVFHTGFRPTTDNAGVNDLEYPIGTTLLCAFSLGTAMRNQIVGVYNDEAKNFAYYTDSGNGARANKLAGVWRVRGTNFSNGGDPYGWHTTVFVQRVS